MIRLFLIVSTIELAGLGLIGPYIAIVVDPPEDILIVNELMLTDSLINSYT